MNTFLKTFFFCLIMAFGLMAYKFLGTDSYSTDLNISTNNPVFGVHKEPELNKDFKNENQVVVEKNETVEQEIKQPKKDEKYIHKCYFYSNSGKLILAKRELSFKPSVENAISILLKGPLIAEAKQGIYSEIPPNVDLIQVKKYDNSIIIDLSANFGLGGGTESVTNRVKQLSKTIKLYEPQKNIYLYINGKEVEYLGGEGVYIKQPLE